jgi:integrase
MIEYIESYLAVRRNAGFQLRVQEGFLRNFACYAAEKGETHVSANSAVKWAAFAPTPHQRANRLDAVRLFARHMHAEDERHEIPPADAFPRRRPPFLPFIFTPDQVRQLVIAAGQLPPSESLRPSTYRTLFSLLAATGMRISEALALQMDDVTGDGLVIRETKFRKSRLVPLHPTAVTGLERYVEQRRKVAGNDNHVFVSLRRSVLKYPTVCAVFLALVRQIGLHQGPGRRGPRIHDLRHTFAVRALESYKGDRQHVGQHMLALSTYMGHAKLESTYWYLHVTPHLLTDIADAVAAFVKGGVQ